MVHNEVFGAVEPSSSVSQSLEITLPEADSDCVSQARQSRSSKPSAAYAFLRSFQYQG